MHKICRSDSFCCKQHLSVPFCDEVNEIINQTTIMESFFRTHAYLVEHLKAPVRRDLMDEINWKDRMIGIKGARGVGKTTFVSVH